MPNAFAYLAIFLWPLLALGLFRRLPLPAGVAAAIFGGYLLLPTKAAVDLPVLPAFDKDLSAIVAALLVAGAAAGRRAPAAAAALPAPLPGWIPRSPLIRLCLFVLFAGTAATALTNSDLLVYGPRVLRGLTTYDTFSALLRSLVLILPFLLGRKYLSDPGSQFHLLATLAVAAALYSFLALYEVRMSPQLNRMVYGFFPHSWLQHIRGGGFRPLVFLQHGLRLSLFLEMGVLAALACAMILPRGSRRRFVAVAAFVFFSLVMSKSLGALMVTLVLAPVLLLAPVRVQILFAAAIATMVLTYPVLRGTGSVPTDRVVAFAASIDPQRARSLQYRLDQEDILLAKAAQRPLFGWSAWGRNRVYNEAGEDVSVTDGTWVIIFGIGGWTRYFAIFGLLCAPILVFAVRRRPGEEARVTAALALIMSGNLIDLIPNSGLTPVTWLLAGAMAGQLERARAPQTQTRTAPARPGPRPAAQGSPTPPRESPATGATRAAPARPGSPYAPVLRPGTKRW